MKQKFECTLMKTVFLKIVILPAGRKSGFLYLFKGKMKKETGIFSSEYLSFFPVLPFNF